jgi:hypothetical protein
MAKIVTLVVALAFAGGGVLWAISPTVERSATVQSISIQELHALAHLDALPIQHFEDMSITHSLAENK